MTLSEINVREKKFHNQLHDSGGQRYENKFYKALNTLYNDFFIYLEKESINKKMLDYGCGAGSYTKKILQFNPSKITAIDISEKAIEVAKQKLTNKKNLV